MSVPPDQGLGDDDVITAHSVTTSTPEQVWQAWEDPQALQRWWSPGGTRVSSSVVELRPGGRLDVISGGRGLSFQLVGEVLAADRPHSFTTTWVWARGEDQIAGRTGTVTLSCQPGPTGTALTVTHRGLGDQDAQRRHREGWARALEGLTEYLHDRSCDDPPG